MGSEIITNLTVNNQTNCTSIKHLIYAFKSIIVLPGPARRDIPIQQRWNGVILMIDLINDPGTRTGSTDGVILHPWKASGARAICAASGVLWEPYLYGVINCNVHRGEIFGTMF